MVAGVAEHKHCEVCGIPIATTERVCSPECQVKLDEAQRMKKRTMWIFIAIIVAVLLLNSLGRNLL